MKRQEQINEARTNYAIKDINDARKHGETLFGGMNTPTGQATLTCICGVYELTTVCLSTFDSIVLASGKPAQIAPVLASLYTVVER